MSLVDMINQLFRFGRFWIPAHAARASAQFGRDVQPRPAASRLAITLIR
jgi:hypothetical protein